MNLAAEICEDVDDEKEDTDDDDDEDEDDDEYTVVSRNIKIHIYDNRGITIMLISMFMMNTLFYYSIDINDNWEIITIIIIVIIITIIIIIIIKRK